MKSFSWVATGISLLLLVPSSVRSMPLEVGPPHDQVPGAISGRVIDERSGRPLAAAQVYIAALDVGVLTQANGSYLLNVPAGTHALAVQLIGYRTVSASVSVTAGATVVQAFGLVEEALGLDEIVVTGTAGGTQRRAIGNVVDRLDIAEIREVSPASQSMEQVLGNRIPGVIMLSTNGPSVGADAGAVRIRGISSTALSNDPIIYVDGVRIYADRQGAGTSGARSRLNDINPADIESMEVIKGPAAATLYGTEASNGVIQIITKRGVQGATTFDASYEGGAAWFHDPDNRVLINYGVHPTTGALIQQHLPTTYKERTGKELFTNGKIERVGLSARGGTDAFRYFASINHSDRRGINQFDYDRLTSGRVSLTVNATQSLTGVLNVSYARSSTRPYSIWGDVIQGRPNNDERFTGIFDPRYGFNGTPPDVSRYSSVQVSRTQRSGYSLELTHSRWAFLTNRLIVGTDLTDQTQDNYSPRDAVAALTSNANLEGARSVSNEKSQVITLDYSGTVRKTVIPALTSATSWGFQYYTRTWNLLSANGQNFASPSLSTVGAASIQGGGGDALQNTTVGFYVQEQVDWNQRVFLTGAIRTDDNSAFGADFDRAVYPKVSATWVLHEEAFWPEPLGITQLRLRGAFGAAGRQPDAIAATQLYEVRPGRNDQPGLYPTAFGNPALGPEKGEELELGFDLAFWDERAQFEFTRYWKTTKDAIVAVPMAPSSGFQGSQLRNVGQVSNWGNEFSLSLDVLNEDPIRWNLGLVFATHENRLDALGPNLDIIPIRRAASHAVGYPLSSLFHYKIVSADFVTGTSGAVTNLMCDAGTGPTGRDMGGEILPCNDPRVNLLYFGTGEPKWSTVLTSSVNVGQNWRIFASLDGRGGHRVSNDELNGIHTTYTNTLASIEMTDPIFQAYRQLRRDPISFHDGAFLKLREISVGYTVPTPWATRIGADRVAVTAAMRNVWTVWQKQKVTDYGNMPVLDPEVGYMPQFGVSGESRSGPGLKQAVVKFDITF